MNGWGEILQVDLWGWKALQVLNLWGGKILQGLDLWGGETLQLDLWGGEILQLDLWGGKILQLDLLGGEIVHLTLVRRWNPTGGLVNRETLTGAGLVRKLYNWTWEEGKPTTYCCKGEQCSLLLCSLPCENIYEIFWINSFPVSPRVTTFSAGRRDSANTWLSPIPPVSAG